MREAIKAVEYLDLCLISLCHIVFIFLLVDQCHKIFTHSGLHLVSSERLRLLFRLFIAVLLFINLFLFFFILGRVIFLILNDLVQARRKLLVHLLHHGNSISLLLRFLSSVRVFLALIFDIGQHQLHRLVLVVHDFEAVVDLRVDEHIVLELSEDVIGLV